MLRSLHIENIAVIKRIDIDFSQGFTALTGETGAGKSIIIDSINLLLGAKADRELIRTGENFAMVSALFSDLSKSSAALLSEVGVSLDDDGNILIQRTVFIDGKSQTGITTMYMAEGLDTGDMLLKDYVDITDTDNFETIHDKLGECGAALIVKTLEGVEAGTIEREPQDDTLATYAAKINKEDCVLDFSKDARTLHNLIRGVSPFPLAFTHTPDGKLLKITSAEVFKENGNYGKAGEVIGLDGGILVACKNGALNITGVLPEGKPRMKASDFVRGRKINVGDILA